MKRLLCAASIIALIVPSVAGAQEQHHRDKSNTAINQSQQRPSRPHNRPKPPSIQPVPSRPGNRPGHRPPVTIQPVPNKPGHRPPTVQPVPNRPHRPPHIRPIRRPPFHYPRGHHYRRWHVGLILPHIFLSNYYFFNDWRLLGLYPPPPGYVWVRYGPDLLLVNRYTGRIRDVIYGAFY